MILRLGVVVLAAGCIPRPPIPTTGPFVRSVDVSGHALTIESCLVRGSSAGLELDTCTRATLKLPFTGDREPLQLAHINRAITPAIRTDIAACGARAELTGQVIVHLEINYTGRLVVAQPKLGDRDLADCIGTALSAAQFPPSSTAVTSANISFDLAAR